METTFLKDYTCCGARIDTLHELLSHYEIHHHDPSNEILHRVSNAGQSERRDSNPPFNSEDSRSYVQQISSRSQPSRSQPDTFNRTQLTTVPDMDSLEDMEMDEPATPSASAGGRTDAPTRQLNTSGMNLMQTQQAFRTSTPTTPSAGTQPFASFLNPTVSSVNTPALSTQPSQQHTAPASPHNLTSDSISDPHIDPTASALYESMSLMAQNGLPIPSQVELFDPNFDYTTFNAALSASGAGGVAGLPDGPVMGGPTAGGPPGAGFGGLTNTMTDLTIDEPARRLSRRGGPGMGPHNTQGQLGQFQFSGQGLQPQRDVEGGPGAAGSGPSAAEAEGFSEVEVKKYKCPVIGCEKKYKNQNGLKYHKTVS